MSDPVLLPSVRLNLIAVQDKWIRDGATAKDCELEVDLLLPAGAEATTTAIRGTFLYILSTPVVYRKLKDEIEEAILQGRISSPITNSEAKLLPYLQAGSTSQFNDSYTTTNTFSAGRY